MPICLHPVVQGQGGGAEAWPQTLCPAKHFKKPLAGPTGVSEETNHSRSNSIRLYLEGNREPPKSWSKLTSAAAAPESSSMPLSPTLQERTNFLPNLPASGPCLTVVSQQGSKVPRSLEVSSGPVFKFHFSGYLLGGLAC